MSALARILSLDNQFANSKSFNWLHFCETDGQIEHYKINEHSPNFWYAETSGGGLALHCSSIQNTTG